jgi:hypothetical protein
MGDEKRGANLPAERLSIERRPDGTIIVAVAASGPRADSVPDARFSFREGDPQYSYWARRFDALPGAGVGR